LCGPEGAFIIDVVDMIFSDPRGHLEGLGAIEELATIFIHALTNLTC